jgi:hypothetical protein
LRGVPITRMVQKHPREDTMPDGIIQLYPDASPLTPRQDRIEASIVRLLGEGGTRSALRDSVHAFADLLRQQGIAPEGAIARIESVASRAIPAIAAPAPHSVGDSADDRMSMIVRWCTARYFRAD